MVDLSRENHARPTRELFPLAGVAYVCVPRRPSRQQARADIPVPTLIPCPRSKRGGGGLRYPRLPPSGLRCPRRPGWPRSRGPGRAPNGEGPARARVHARVAAGTGSTAPATNRCAPDRRRTANSVVFSLPRESPVWQVQGRTPGGAFPCTYHTRPLQTAGQGRQPSNDPNTALARTAPSSDAVSYTHLTLPTKRIV